MVYKLHTSSININSVVRREGKDGFIFKSTTNQELFVPLTNWGLTLLPNDITSLSCNLNGDLVLFKAAPQDGELALAGMVTIVSSLNRRVYGADRISGVENIRVQK